MSSRALLLLLCACAPAFVDEPWRLTGPTIIGVVADPPEVAAGGQATLSAVIAGGDAGVSWARCDAAPPLGQNGPIAAACLEALRSASATEGTFSLQVPFDACQRFGPQVGTAGVRPRDPDATGGWYQPIGAALDGQQTFAFERLTCEPGNVSTELAQALRAVRSANQNPTISLTAQVNGVDTPVDQLPAGRELVLVPTLDPPETFTLIDPTSLQLVEQVETFEISWFVTQGALSSARTAATPVRFTPPRDPGAATVWAVVRDSRGGLAVAHADLVWN